MSKSKLTKEQARQKMMSYLDGLDFKNKVYEFAQNLCDDAIQDIESEYDVVDANGMPYINEDDEKWYDEHRNDFMKTAFEKLKMD